MCYLCSPTFCFLAILGLSLSRTTSLYSLSNRILGLTLFFFEQKNSHAFDHWSDLFKHAIDGVGTLGHVRAIHVIAQHFCETHDSNPAIPSLASVTMFRTTTNAPHPQRARLDSHNCNTFMNLKGIWAPCFFLFLFYLAFPHINPDTLL